MKKVSAGLALLGLAFSVGCGGNGTNPPVMQFGAEYRYPAYQARSEEGDEVRFLLKEEAGQYKGQFFYFPAVTDEHTVLSGRITGTRSGNAVAMTLHMDFAPGEPPIQLEGTVSENGFRVHDVDTPEDVVDVTPIQPPTVRALSRSASRDVARTFQLTSHNRRYWFTNPGEIFSPNPVMQMTSATIQEDGFSPHSDAMITLGSWQNGLAWVDVTDFHRGIVARLWLRPQSESPTEGIRFAPGESFHPDSTARGFFNSWVKATGYYTEN